MHTKIKFEPPRQKREIPQCTKCQRYGHTKSFCNHQPRCVKCAANHHTTECSRKTKSDNVLCVVCNKNHPANYKGCQVYRDLQEKTYPALRKKELGKSTNINIPNTTPAEAGITYAQALRDKNLLKPTTIPKQALNPTSSKEPSELGELKNMMKTLMEQMSTMLNLLTSLVSKLT